MATARIDDRSPIEIVGGYVETAPVDLHAMASELGLQVITVHDLPNEISGKIERISNLPSRFRATINGRHGHRRQRFTLAHEIAHLVLHADLIGDGVVDDAMYRSTALSSERESEANRFAASILMPGPLMRQKKRGGMHSFADFADAFEVSEEVAKIRMREIFRT